MFKFARSNQIWPLCDKGEYGFASMKLKPHKTGVSIEKTFTSPLYPVEGVDLIITQEARVTVQGILHTSSSHICSSCNKKIVVHHGNWRRISQLILYIGHWKYPYQTHTTSKSFECIATNQTIHQPVALCEIPQTWRPSLRRNYWITFNALGITYDAQQRKKMPKSACNSYVPYRNKMQNISNIRLASSLPHVIFIKCIKKKKIVTSC